MGILAAVATIALHMVHINFMRHSRNNALTAEEVNRMGRAAEAVGILPAAMIRWLAASIAPSFAWVQTGRPTTEANRSIPAAVSSIVVFSPVSSFEVAARIGSHQNPRYLPDDRPSGEARRRGSRRGFLPSWNVHTCLAATRRKPRFSEPLRLAEPAPAMPRPADQLETTGRGTMSKFTRLVAAVALAPLLATAGAQVKTLAGGGSRPYRVTMTDEIEGLPHHTVYMPQLPAAQKDAKLPIFVWANGACADVGNAYRYFLDNIASHGYLVVTIGKIGPAGAESHYGKWPAEFGIPKEAPPLDGPTGSLPFEMKQAIDWAVAQNSAEDSPLKGRIDTSRIGVAGHSCGTLQALSMSSTDPRITTTLMLNGGVWNIGTGGLPGAPEITKNSLKTIHGTIAYIHGEKDSALPNGSDDYSRIEGIPVMLAVRKDVAHSGTFWLKNGGAYGTVALAWLDWQLKGDEKASRWFVGKDCRLCTDPRWTVERKNFP
jgi:dienelactone hydrolase